MGLDRLDAIETGLLPVGDIRNLRKTTDRYGQVEYEKTRLERTLSEHGEEQLLEHWASKKMEKTILWRDRYSHYDARSAAGGSADV